MPYKIMIVEDAVMMRTVIKNLIHTLLGSDFQVVDIASNGKEALEKMSTHKDLDLILLDIEMPEMDGLEFLRHARLRTQAKICILSSVALSGSPYAAKARMLGADAIVTKPSGAVSHDLVQKRGGAMVTAIRRLVGAV